MDLKQIRSYIVVCETQSLSRAADVLGLSQPSLSRQMQMLEAELRHHLLTRTGRGVVPTPAGLRFLEHAKALDDLAAHARQDMRSYAGTAQERVRLGMPHRVARRLAPRIVQTFRRQHADAALTVAEGLSSEMSEWLLKDRVDLALLYDPQPSRRVRFESVYREELVLAYVKACRPAPPRRVRASELSRYPLVLPSAPNTIRALVDKTCRELDVELHIAAEVDVVHTILETVTQDNLYTILPRSALHDSPGQHELACSEIIDPVIMNNLTLATPMRDPLPPLVEATAKIIRSLDMRQLFA
ncbi:LysR family transcriptional regulator [Bordetella genomosp. 9]|uniref:LysR family transcriptional regulator n=1 Tax=Bordetella genomosp. 9 TaxID=1416803 RepID=A0A1W6YZU9_9BORD|nr:LysR family transcriptional regulator [Bordetella genomosp. 9]ARP86635.1 LysR family transcriptional regulator [Bordetella genomosp. 9]ARP90634.1 LysR family transcriptional regulator [Bordetella genomosp. 9]